jgi:hypothetical protein
VIIIAIDKNKVKQARQTDLASVLTEKFVYDLRFEGYGQYRDKEHSSLVIKENMYCWNSKGESGNSLDFLVRYHNLSFRDAVDILTNSSSSVVVTTINDNKEAKNNSFELDLIKDFEKGYRYLVKRAISGITVNAFREKKLLALTKEHNNIAFLIKDENGEIVGAELQGTTEKRFKGIAKNSKSNIGFNIKTDEAIENIYVFESAIDLMSFYSLYRTKGIANNCLLISLSGLKINTLKNMLKIFHSRCEPGYAVYLCLDRDAAARNFIDKATEDISFLRTIEVPDFQKDWNDYIKHLRDIRESAYNF